jgi:hypothetical protein
VRATGLELRAFAARAEDFDVDFDAGDRSAVATAVIARCSGLPDDEVWALDVGTRIHVLVVVAQLAGRSELSWSVPCPAPECDEGLEIGLSLAVLAQAAHEAGEPAAVASFRPRRPTGDDLRAWRARPPSDAELAATLGDGAPVELAAEVEAALAAADPLVDARVESACPACGEALGLAVDLEAELLALARRRQDALVRDVAALAGAFGWSERDILALPPARRRRYLATLEQAA